MKTIILLTLIFSLASCKKETLSKCGEAVEVTAKGVWVRFPERNFSFIVRDTTGIKVGQQICR